MSTLSRISVATSASIMVVEIGAFADLSAKFGALGRVFVEHVVDLLPDGSKVASCVSQCEERPRDREEKHQECRGSNAAEVR